MALHATSEALRTQGLHHLTLVGAGRDVSVDFWSGLLGMPLVHEEPNEDNPAESHLHFDPGDGRMITVFANEDRERNSARTSTETGAVHHIALSVSAESLAKIEARLDERGIAHSGRRHRGFTESIYFEDPLGMLIELARYSFAVPDGYTVADVMIAAHHVRASEGARSIEPAHVTAAVNRLSAQRTELPAALWNDRLEARVAGLGPAAR
jgi:catechol 2,3-dioxygenase-like lactoylglutathione lyase family enzyme